ncbi:hypothetical protein [Terriglobus sp.]|uniref:hypothetical protein n=1 Tax=Terriglobus sp. TaxID=1889013 RepID=UPI003B000B92
MPGQPEEEEAQGTALLRVAGQMLCALALLVLSTIPFAFGLVVQAFVPRRLSRVVACGFATAAFLAAWLAFDHAPLLVMTRGGRLYWFGLVLDWLLSLASFVYASFLLRAFWPRRFHGAMMGLARELEPKSGATDAEAGVRLRHDVRLALAWMRFWFRELRFSVVAAGVVFVLGLVSMGLLGAMLHGAVMPVLALLFPHAKTLLGDWVWPAMIGTGQAWAVAFLIAGAADRLLKRRSAGVPVRVLLYVAILWCWDLVIWSVTLLFAPVPQQ